MPRKFSELKLTVLKDICAHQGLKQTGLKSEVLARLIEHYKSDEIPTDLEKEIEDEASMISMDVGSLRAELDALREIVKTLAQAQMPAQSSVRDHSNMAATEDQPIPNRTRTTETEISSDTRRPQRRRNNCVARTHDTDEDDESPHARDRILDDRNYRTSYRGFENENNSAFNRVRDIVEILPDFNPMKSTSLNSKQFVARVNRLQEVYQWDERVLLFAVQSKLQGQAKVWNDAQMEVFTEWRTFSDRLTQDFPVYESDADIHIEMITSTRRNDEPVEEYLYRMCAKGRQGCLNDTAIIKYIRNGLRHTSLQSVIASQEFRNVNELIVAVKRYLHNMQTYNDNSRNANRERYNTKNRTPGSPNTVATGTPKDTSGNTENVTSVKPQDKQNSDNGSTSNNRNTRPNNRKGVCFNCFEPGHLSINCPKPQRRARCNQCSKSGHTEENCTQPETPPIEPTNLVRRITQTEPKTITKIVKIDHANMTAIIDPGSARSLIRRGDTLGLKRCNEKKTVCLKGFAGGLYECREIVRARLTIDEQEVDGALCIVEDDMIPEPLLLGVDVLCRDKTRLIIEETECRLERVDAQNLNVPTELTDAEQKKFRTVLREYNDCFAEDLTQLGQCRTAEMQIRLTTEQPINRRPYRVPFAKRQVVEKLVQELLDTEIVRPSESEYSSPIVLVPKKTGEDRLCVDYRLVNSVTVKQPFPMPIVEEQLSSLSGNTYFTSLDLMSGYYQVPVAEDSRKYTAFSTHNGHYEFNKMPFGLVNAPSVFQRMINDLVRQMPHGEAIAYLDDIIVPSRTVLEGLDRLERYLQLLRRAGLTLRPNKCVFFATELSFLGHEISKDGIKPGTAKVACIRNFPKPNDVHSVRRFLGLCGFFRKFIKDFAQIGQPLTKLLKTKNGPEFEWKTEQNEAFEKLKTLLCSEPILVLYDPRREHELHTDASSDGLAGVLLQRDDEERLRVVYYYSRQCTDIERLYHSYELEVLAITESLERFRVYLLGKHFRIVTDCSAVSSTKNTKPLVPRVARWFLKLQEYDFELVHRPGQSIPHVDSLSRAPFEKPTEPTIVTEDIMRVEVTQEEWLTVLQMQDPKLQEICQILEDKKNSEQAKQIKKEYELRNKRLYRKDGNEIKFVLPAAVRWKMLQYYHDLMGHYSVEKTLQRLKRDFWFPKMRKLTKKYVAACLECCYNRGKGGKTEGELHADELMPIPFATLHIDHLGPFPKSKRQNLYLIVVVDAFSKFLIVRAVRNTKTQPVITLLNDLTTYFGLPKRIVTDRGTAYTSQQFESYCQNNHIQHVKNAVRTPRANGQVERFNRTILSYLKSSTEDAKNWDDRIREMQWTLNTQKNETTGFTPNELIFDFQLRDLIPNRLVEALHDEDFHEPDVTTTEKRQEAEAKILEHRQKWKTRFDACRRKPFDYQEGDLVVIENVPAATGDSRKLEPRYRGPYIVKKCLGRDRYLIEDIPGMTRTQKRFSSVYTAEKMKLWCDTIPEVAEEDDESDEEDDPEPRTTQVQEGPNVTVPRKSPRIVALQSQKAAWRG